jgi:CheY-like chemotaxis protein
MGIEFRPRARSPEPTAQLRPQSRTLHILLVDDDLLVRGGTAEMLDDAGHHIVEAGSADEALVILRSGADFDLLITDNCMPGMSGAELIVHVREDKPDLPVLLITGYATREARLDGGVALLPKPFRQAGLLSAISALTAG